MWTTVTRTTPLCSAEDVWQATSSPGLLPASLRMPRPSAPSPRLQSRRVGSRGTRGAALGCPRFPPTSQQQAIRGAPRAPPAPGLAAVAGVHGHLPGGVRRLGPGVPRQEAVEAVQEEGRASGAAGAALERARGAAGRLGGVGGRAAVPALRDGQDAAVEDGALGPQDAVQRVRGAVQVGQAGAGVSARGEPHLRDVEALQLPPQGAGAAPPEGGAAPAAARDRRRWSWRDDAHAEPASVRRARGAARHRRRRLLDPPPLGGRLPAAYLDMSLACARIDQLAQ